MLLRSIAPTKRATITRQNEELSASLPDMPDMPVMPLNKRKLNAVCLRQIERTAHRDTKRKI